MDHLITRLDMWLEPGVDLDGPALVGLLLVDNEIVVIVEQLPHLRERRSLMRNPKKMPQPINRLSAYFSSR